MREKVTGKFRERRDLEAAVWLLKDFGATWDLMSAVTGIPHGTIGKILNGRRPYGTGNVVKPKAA